MADSEWHAKLERNTRTATRIGTSFGMAWSACGLMPGRWWFVPPIICFIFSWSIGDYLYYLLFYRTGWYKVQRRIFDRILAARTGWKPPR